MGVPFAECVDAYVDVAASDQEEEESRGEMNLHN